MLAGDSEGDEKDGDGVREESRTVREVDGEGEGTLVSKFVCVLFCWWI